MGFLDPAVLDGLAEGVEFDTQFLSDSTPGPATEQEFLRATDDVQRHHRRSTFGAGLIERRHAPFVELFDPALHGVLRDAEGLEDFGLPTVSLNDQGSCKPLERRVVVLGVVEDRNNSTEVGPDPALLDDTDPVIDLRGPIGDKCEQCLWHGYLPLSNVFENQEEGTISFSAAQSVTPLLAIAP